MTSSDSLRLKTLAEVDEAFAEAQQRLGQYRLESGAILVGGAAGAATGVLTDQDDVISADQSGGAEAALSRATGGR